jgi:NAD(P)H-hydrate epimerase
MTASPVIPVLTAAESAAWDARARTDAGIPGRVLMESAGRAAAAVIARELAGALGRGALVVAGPGNNGGDGWVVARALHAAGLTVWGTDLPQRRSPDCEANRTLALGAGVEFVEPDGRWPAAGVIVDALLGTGASEAPRGPLAELARHVAAHGAPVAAVDGPTGLDLTTGVAHGPIRATLTVTFGGLRRGHLLARDWAGRVVVVEMGFPPADPAWPAFVTDAWAAAMLPGFSPAMHKGDRGRVLVVGGDVGMAGAAMHVARTAFACGAGLVKLALPQRSLDAAQANLPDALTVATALGPGIEPDLAQALDWADAIVLGPGLGRGDARAAFARAVLERAVVPVVIDADALHVPGLAGVGDAPRVLTPHPGEFAAQFPALADLARDDRFAAPTAALESLSACPPARLSAVLLKGVPTVIAGDAGVRVVGAGNPALATGGSGDLLAGTIAAFLARGLPPLDASSLGAHVMGRAADLLAARRGVRGTRPEDVAGAYPEVWDVLGAPVPPAPPVLLTLDPPAVS